MPKETKRFVYVFDALCPWCYGFTPVVQQVRANVDQHIPWDVLSGGMVRHDDVRTISGEEEAYRLRQAYVPIEETAGVQFGEAFFNNIAQSERHLDSHPPAMALATFRHIAPEGDALRFAHLLLQAVFRDGADVRDDEMYSTLATQMNLDAEAFIAMMNRPEAHDSALYDFALAKQIGATSFPRLYYQTATDYLYLVAQGYTSFDDLMQRIAKIEEEIGG